MSIAESRFGDNATIHQGNVYHYSSDGASDRCLADLRSTDPRDDKIRNEQTKGGLLKELYNWILENDKFKLWSKYDIAGKGVFEDVNAWTALSHMLLNVLQDTGIDNTILVIDAGDECEADQAKLLDFILQHSSLPRVKWIITSRNGPIIKQKLSTCSSRALLSLELKDIEAKISDAVDTYIKYSVSRLDLVRDDKELQDDLEKAMRQKVNGTFLWVSLVMKELEQVESWDALHVVDEIPSDLKEVYARILGQILQLKRGSHMYCMQLLSTASLHGMSQILKRDLWDLKAPGIPIDEIMTPEPDPLATTRYSCVYWVDHLCDGISETWTQINDLDDDRIINQFLKNRYLYWIEALSLQRSVSYGVTALNKLEALLQKMEKKQLMQSADIIRDARRFIFTHKKMIEIAPLQIYASAPLFSPAESLIKRLFSKEEPAWIASKPTMDAKWGPCLQVLEGDESTRLGITCSADGQRLVTASVDKLIIFWDSPKGECLLTLRGHRAEVRSAVYSADCQKLVSASDDGTIKMWDARNGNCLQTFEFKNHSYSYKWVSVTLSSNGKLASTLSKKNDLIVWDLADIPSQILNMPASAYSKAPSSPFVVFSADNPRFAIHWYGEIDIWDIATNCPWGQKAFSDSTRQL
ncbi:uncharacterized protein Triagg1_10806 [Trichoderma aggressivum f. europaeum]|uniref:Nephrocystin 3-like N-terminal domain-containing protein n=1 Tax=Trichoderma aggressivum f. europaeum TaxID=173218 RepID=A0AAE1LUX0_9HYPO|nr:hypothetical protein Triagg1_10806 [Trichoderma aggressivum f. europaeum]